jgi:hypothetical protein
MNDETERFEATLEERGEASVKADLAHTNHFGADTLKVQVWLNRKEAERQDEQRQSMFASVRSAKDAAQIARESARASQRSALWTMVAAIVTVVGVALNALSSLGWLDWAKHITK